MSLTQPQTWFGGEGTEERNARLRKEIGVHNAILKRIEHEDLELTQGIRENSNDHDLVNKNTRALAENSRATIENRREVMIRAEKLKITPEEALAIPAEE